MRDLHVEKSSPEQQIMGEATHIRLTGQQTVQKASTLKTTLQEALAAKAAISINLDDVESIDASALQLLVSAQAQATAEGLTFGVACAASSPAGQLLRAIGFVDANNTPTFSQAANWTIHTGHAP